MARLAVLTATAILATALFAAAYAGAGGSTNPPFCTNVSFPPTTISGESLLSLAGCHAFSSLTMSLPVRFTTFNKYAIVAGASLSTGECTGKHTKKVTCRLAPALKPGATFLFAFAPLIKVGEPIAISFKPLGGGPPVTQKVTVPANLKLGVHTVVTAYAGTGSYAPNTAFTFSTTITGGTYQQIAFDLPAGNSVLYTLQQPANGLQCGAQATAGGVQEFICSDKGPTPVAPGVFTFSVGLAHPIGPGTQGTGHYYQSSARLGFKYQW
jgi:hypothetical protein